MSATIKATATIELTAQNNFFLVNCETERRPRVSLLRVLFKESFYWLSLCKLWVTLLALCGYFYCCVVCAHKFEWAKADRLSSSLSPRTSQISGPPPPPFSLSAHVRLAVVGYLGERGKNWDGTVSPPFRMFEFGSKVLSFFLLF